ncbi:histidine kinase [Actinoplanes sp. NPDC026670]|uniref:sensor histidine kinase n=1 Tax=Actinoplanes sp. NPDC026670 TaxID=3154700 RepID=UPI0033FF9775
MSTARSRTGAVLAWAGTILFPFALFAVVVLPGFTDPLLRVVTVVAALVLPVGLARRAPLPALALLVIGGAAVSVLAISGGFPEMAVVGAFVVVADLMVGNVASRRERRVSITAAVLTAIAQVTMMLVFENPGDLLTVPAVMILAVVTAWVAGDSIRQRRRHAAAQREQAEARAVEAERLRIARELHDMVTHSIAVIAVQAGMGRRVIDTQPAEARAALANIEETSRDTAAALRRMLGSLRRTDAGSGPAPREPAPGLADLDGLVARSAQAGVVVGLRRDGDAVPLPPDIDLSAYRIVQEAVTNVIRHASVGRCDVEVRQDAGTLTIEITDDGTGAGGSTDSSRNGSTDASRNGSTDDSRRGGTGSSRDDGTDGSRNGGTDASRNSSTDDSRRGGAAGSRYGSTDGSRNGSTDGSRRGGAAGSRNGITGMRERVSLLGGEFDAGPRPGGGFRVTARIPLPESATQPASRSW